MVFRVVVDFCRLLCLASRSRRVLATENLFLRKQLALFQERQVRPRRATDATRFLMALLSRWFDWRSALVIVKPDTLIRWHRKGFGLFWRRKSRPVGRPPIPEELRQLIRIMAVENITWGEERIANELKLKLGIRVAPSTVCENTSTGETILNAVIQPSAVNLRSQSRPGDCCLRFLHGGHGAIRYPLCALVVMELGRRQILHYGVTEHPTAEWTLQQFREALPGSHPYGFVIHDRDSIFSTRLDEAVAALGVRILRTPVRLEPRSKCRLIVRLPQSAVLPATRTGTGPHRRYCFRPTASRRAPAQ